MGAEQYQALLWLVSGTSLFVIMLLGMRLLASEGGRRTDEVGAEWLGPEPLKICAIINETPDIKTFVLRRREGLAMPAFKPGQFLSFQIEADPKTIRSYSISSIAPSPEFIQVSIKRLPDGKGSNWFHSLSEGDEVMTYAPSGHFFDEMPEHHPRVYVAGGIGVTPILAMVADSVNRNKKYPIHIFYGARTESDLAFHDYFVFLAKRHSHVHYYPVLSHQPQWSGDTGYLTFSYIKDRVADLAKACFFVCGPDAMTAPLLQALEQEGVPEAQIFNEKFVSPVSFDPASLPEHEVQIQYLGKTHHYRGRQSLLEFLEAQGESLPYACRTGVCGSCKCKISGAHKLITDSGLSRADKLAGYSLACVAYPEGDCQVT